MEALELSEAADDSSGNSGMVKSEDGSPNHSTGRGSPPPNCAICLGRCKNKSFTDSCLHQFCFKCLLTWSRVKTECPLCKQNFKSIIHNVKSNHQYEEYPVQQPQTEERAPNLDFNEMVNSSRFRYRTTLTLPRRETLAIRQFLMHYPLAAALVDLPQRERTRRQPADFRRTIYRHNMWARPLPDFTGRFRDSTPEFFRYNDSQVHRLVPWLNRELFYLLNENGAHVTYVMGRILELLPVHPILSTEFRDELHRYLGDHTNHFVHEFHCFASTPYDITGYDRHVQYATDPVGTRALVSEVLSSSDTDSHDSDIVMVSSSRAATPPPAPPPLPPLPPAVIPIETISHSDTDSDSEVIVTGYIKPPHQRTPEMVDLLASDSDVVVQEEEAPSPRASNESVDEVRIPIPWNDSLVRVKLSVAPRDAAPARPYPPAAPRRKRRHPPASTSDKSYTPTSSPAASSESESPDGTSSSSSSSHDARRKRTPKRKIRRKRTRAPRLDTHASRRRKEKKKEKSPDAVKSSKGKSRNGKDVKSSKISLNQIPLPVVSPPAVAGPSDMELYHTRRRGSELAPEAAGPSGLASCAKRKRSSEATTPDYNRAGPSGVTSSPKRKSSTESTSRQRTRDTHESKRLKSVIKVVKRNSDRNSDSSESQAMCSRSDSSRSASRRVIRAVPSPSHRGSSSSSDDNIPLVHAIPHSNRRLSDYSV